MTGEGYYIKTLNLEVMVMLANRLVEKLETVLTVDWDQVTGFKEFSGHTTSSLRRLLHELATVKHFKTPKLNSRLPRCLRSSTVTKRRSRTS